MTACAKKHVKSCPTRGAHEHVHKCDEWSRQCSWHYTASTGEFINNTRERRLCGTESFTLNMFLSLNVL